MPMSKEKESAVKEFIKIRNNFTKLAHDLLEAWDNEHLNGTAFAEGFPEGLPSFDEFVCQLDRWNEKDYVDHQVNSLP
jgi:hypothetical protein